MLFAEYSRKYAGGAYLRGGTHGAGGFVLTFEVCVVAVGRQFQAGGQHFVTGPVCEVISAGAWGVMFSKNIHSFL